MTVREMIERLQNLDPDIVVRAYDADSETFEEVSGFLVTALAADIQTDDIND